MKNVPENAKLVFEGVRCKVYHWDQEMFDGTTAVFEKVVRLPAVTVFAIQDGKISMQEQIQPHKKESFLCLPGGMVDKEGENILEAAKRELIEETGLESKDWEFWKISGVSGYIHWENHIYIARDCEKVAELKLDAGEKIENKLVTFDEFFSFLEDPRFRHRDFLGDLYRIRESEEETLAFKKLLGIK